jgi:uncharacterized protein YaiI (UPF0178 family)
VLVVYVDADACPVKEEVYRVAERYGLETHVVSGSFVRVPQGPLFHQTTVESGPDAADDWIVEHIGPGDIVITSDVPLAARAVKKKGWAITPKGRVDDERTIGANLATRDLMTQLRDQGEITGGPRAFEKQDRSRFLSALDTLVHTIRKEARLGRL